MSKKNQLEQFKNLIKECVREVVKEEFAILQENQQPVQGIQEQERKYVNNLEEELKQKFNPSHHPVRTGDEPNYTKLPTTGDPMLDILNETKAGMSEEDFRNIGSFGSSQAPNFGGNYRGVGGEVQVGTTQDMLKTATPTKDINQVSIDVVPDYRKLMGAMDGKK